MPIQVKWLSILPAWAWNWRDLQPGEEVSFARSDSRGDWIWRIIVLSSPETYRVEHQAPNTSVKVMGIAQAGEITKFGPRELQGKFRHIMPRGYYR